MRKFIRHPISIPIEVSITNNSTSNAKSNATDLGAGGLAFKTSCSIEPGTVICITIPFIQPEFKTDARVVWCRKRLKGTELGVEFLTCNDAYKVRMVEQVCYIENYKNMVKRKEGRYLTSQQAASEWIKKFAVDFPK